MMDQPEGDPPRTAEELQAILARAAATEEQELLRRMLLENPLFKKVAEGIVRDHGMTVLEAARDLREFW